MTTSIDLLVPPLKPSLQRGRLSSRDSRLNPAASQDGAIWAARLLTMFPRGVMKKR